MPNKPELPQAIQELAQHAQWVCWKFVVTEKGKTTKVPYNPRTGKKALTTNPSTWSSFETVMRWRDDYDGIGFVFTENDPYCGIDLDHAFEEDGTLRPWAQDIVDRFGCYTEYSPSQTGLHVICRAKHPGEHFRCDRDNGHVEIYDHVRYFTVTANPFIDAPILESQAALDKLHGELFPPRPEPVHTTSPIAPAPSALSDSDVLDLMFRSSNGSDIQALWNGDDKGDHSSADISLCNHLAFWCGKDVDQMDRLFRQSGLMRAKWDSRRGKTTYGRQTIDLAVRDCQKVFTPGGQDQGPLWGHKAGENPEKMKTATSEMETVGRIFGKDTINKAAEAWAEHVRGQFLYTSNDQWWLYVAGRWMMVDTPFVEQAIRSFLLPKWKGDMKPEHVNNVAKMSRLMLLLKAQDMGGKPTLIPFSNGVLDTETGSFLDHSPDLLLTRQLSFIYDPDADCPQFNAFLEQVLLARDGQTCRQWIDVMQEWFGYLLMADSSAQTAMVWLGTGANGKGVLTKVMEAFVGRDYSTAVAIDQLKDPYHRADLFGKLLGTTGDLDRTDMRHAAGWFKAIVGGDTISARHPGGRVFHFVPTMRLVISCNDLPDTNDVSYGYFRRLLIIDFRMNVPERQKILDLPERLIAEMPGIFNWALIGLKRFLANERRFTYAEESDAVKQEYRAQQDPVAGFLEERCERDAGDLTCWTWSDVLYEAYRDYCFQEGLKAVGSLAFGHGLSRNGVASTELGWDAHRTKPRKYRPGVRVLETEHEHENPNRP